MNSIEKEIEKMKNQLSESEELQESFISNLRINPRIFYKSRDEKLGI